jgi:hypothetical protein
MFVISVYFVAVSTRGHIHRMDNDRMVKKYVSGNQHPQDHKSDQDLDGKMTQGTI